MIDFTDRVGDWAIACFGAEIAMDKEQRADRLLEEVFELLQAAGYSPDRVGTLRDYVWSRPVGKMQQEVGGAAMTLAAFCFAHDIDMEAAAEGELNRVWQNLEKIRAKQAAKPAGSPLPRSPMISSKNGSKTTGRINGGA